MLEVELTIAGDVVGDSGYAVQINTNGYEPYITAGVFAVCSPRLQPLAGDQVFVILSNGERFLARLRGEWDAPIRVLQRLTADLTVLRIPAEEIVTLDVVVGIERPMDERSLRD